MNDLVVAKEMLNEGDVVLGGSWSCSEQLGHWSSWSSGYPLSGYNYAVKALKDKEYWQERLFQKEKLREIKMLINSHHVFEMAMMEDNGVPKISIDLIDELLRKNIPNKYFYTKIIELSYGFGVERITFQFYLMKSQAISIFEQKDCDMFVLRTIPEVKVKTKCSPAQKLHWSSDYYRVVKSVVKKEPSPISKDEFVDVLKLAVKSKGNCSEKEYIDAWAKRLISEVWGVDDDS